MSKSSSSMFASINRTSFVTESEKIVKLKGRPALLSKNVNELSRVFFPAFSTFWYTACSDKLFSTLNFVIFMLLQDLVKI